MASPMMSFVFLLFVLMQQTDGSLRLEINPVDITPSLTKSLIVNCSFSFAGVANMSDIIALTVSKSEVNGSQFVDLVSVNVFTPDELTLQPGFDAIASGHMDTDKESFLSMVWTYPTSNQTGRYQCVANGVDNFGHPIEMFQTMQVISQQSNLDKLTEKVSQLQRQLEREETQSKNQSDEINKLLILAKNQSSEIDQLLSLTKTQAEIISTLQSQLAHQSVTITDLQTRLNFQGLFIEELNSEFSISSKYNNHYYVLSKDNYENATVSEKTCQDFGGYLAQITDDGESQFVNDFLDQNFSEIFDVLVSGTDENHEGKWTFTGTDTDIVYTDWEQGRPLISQSHNCIGLDRGFQWQWKDYSCNGSTYLQFPFLCEVETV